MPAEAEAYAAEVFAALGRSDEAIAAVGRPPAIMLPFLYWSGMWAPARARPAFARLMSALGWTEEHQRACAPRRVAT